MDQEERLKAKPAGRDQIEQEIGSGGFGRSGWAGFGDVFGGLVGLTQRAAKRGTLPPETDPRGRVLILEDSY